MFSSARRWRSAAADQRAPARNTRFAGTRRAILTLAAASAAAFATAAPATANPIAAGESHSCVVRGEAGIFCWGQNANGQLGTANTKTYLYRIRTKLSINSVAIAAGDRHTCAVRRNGTVGCWGSNEFGQIGDGSGPGNVTKMVQVAGITDAIDVVAGENHTCALRQTGAVECWGLNTLDQLGNRSSIPVSRTPITVTGATSTVALGAGGNHTCAVRASGTVRCWGSNTYGELGSGTNSISRPLVNVSNMTEATSVAAGDNHTCVTLRNSRVNCWGRGADGQLALGHRTPELVNLDYNTPQLAFATASGTVLSGVTAITAGGNHTCALKTDESMRCWGRNLEGELGNRTTVTSSLPVVTERINTGVAIAAGPRHTCALRSNDDLLCWGGNGGQLGFGPSNDKDFTRPMRVHALPSTGV